MRHYEAPETVDGLLAALAADPAALVLAGGHSLLPAMAIRGQHVGRLVDIGRITALKALALDDRGASIGAGATLTALLASPITVAYPALAAAIRFVGNHVVRNRSTVGGCLGWADPRGEVLTILIALDATIVTSGRTIAADQFATGPFATVLQPGEVIISVSLPPAQAQALAFDEVIARNSTGRAIVSVACGLTADRQVRMTVAGLVDRAVRSAALKCGGPAEFAVLARSFVDDLAAHFPVLADTSSPAYRRAIAPRLLARCYARLTA